MKRLCLAAAIIILGISALHAAGAGPRINAIGKEWDLGNVPMGGKAEKVFEISNGGSSDLVIENVKSCCGYSVTDISSWKIKPGKIQGLSRCVEEGIGHRQEGNNDTLKR